VKKYDYDYRSIALRPDQYEKLRKLQEKLQQDRGIRYISLGNTISILCDEYLNRSENTTD